MDCICSKTLVFQRLKFPQFICVSLDLKLRRNLAISYKHYNARFVGERNQNLSEISVTTALRIRACALAQLYFFTP